jgi:hypothetical protein
MAKRNNIEKQTLKTAAKDSEVYTGDNTADIDNISCERKTKKYIIHIINSYEGSPLLRGHFFVIAICVAAHQRSAAWFSS